MIRTKRQRVVLVLAIFMLAGAPAFAQKREPPAGGPPKAFTLPAHETYALTNGMKVTLVPYGNIPKVTINVTLRTGNLNEPKELLGIADITGDLLKEGTTSMSAKALA